MFTPLNIDGILAFVVDRRRRVKQLRLFDINNFRLLFQVEIYLNFNVHYREIKSTFFCFPLPKLTVGIEFSNLEDAAFFKVLVDRFSPKFESHINMTEY